jgi:hypothetical protein
VKFNRVGNKKFNDTTQLFLPITNDVAEKKRTVEQSFAQSTIWGFSVAAGLKAVYW